MFWTLKYIQYNACVWNKSQIFVQMFNEKMYSAFSIFSPTPVIERNVSLTTETGNVIFKT